jgi:hypothetical protein
MNSPTSFSNKSPLSGDINTKEYDFNNPICINNKKITVVEVKGCGWILLKNVNRYCFKNVDRHCLKMWMDIVLKCGWTLFTKCGWILLKTWIDIVLKM